METPDVMALIDQALAKIFPRGTTDPREITDLDRRITRLEGQSSGGGATVDLSGVQGQISTLSSEVSRVSADQSNTNSKVTNIEQSVRQVEKDVTALDNNLTKVESNIPNQIDRAIHQTVPGEIRDQLEPIKFGLTQIQSSVSEAKTASTEARQSLSGVASSITSGISSAQSGIEGKVDGAKTAIIAAIPPGTSPDAVISQIKPGDIVDKILSSSTEMQSLKNGMELKTPAEMLQDDSFQQGLTSKVTAGVNSAVGPAITTALPNASTLKTITDDSITKLGKLPEFTAALRNLKYALDNLTLIKLPANLPTNDITELKRQLEDAGNNISTWAVSGHMENAANALKQAATHMNNIIKKVDDAITVSSTSFNTVENVGTDITTLVKVPEV